MVRSHAKRGFDAKDKLVMCILEVKLPTVDAAGHETYILNIVRNTKEKKPVFTAQEPHSLPPWKGTLGVGPPPGR